MSGSILQRHIWHHEKLQGTKYNSMFKGGGEGKGRIERKGETDPISLGWIGIE